MKKLIYIITMVLSLYLFDISITYAQTSNTALFIRAKQYSLNGEYDKAINTLNQILQSEKSMYIYDFLIENQINAKKIDDALATSKKAYKDFPKEAKYLYLEATIYKEYKMDFKKAYEIMQKCLNIKKTNEYMMQTAILAGIVKDYKEAEKLLDELIKENPEDTRIYVLRADTYIQQKKTAKAIKDLEKAISIDGSNTAKLMLAEIYLGQKKDDKTIAILEEVARDNQNISSLVEQNIGKIYRDKGDFDKAIEVYQRLADKLYGQSKAIILMQLGDVLNMAGRYEEAGKVFEEITTLIPDEITYYYIAGKFYEYTKNYKKAEELYKGALKLNPTYAQVLKRITVVYLLQDRTKDALKYINMIDEDFDNELDIPQDELNHDEVINDDKVNKTMTTNESVQNENVEANETQNDICSLPTNPPIKKHRIMHTNENRMSLKNCLNQDNNSSEDEEIKAEDEEMKIRSVSANGEEEIQGEHKVKGHTQTEADINKDIENLIKKPSIS